MKAKDLTPDQREHIINSCLTNTEVGKLYGISHKIISQIRLRAKNHIPGKRLTLQQKNQVLNSTESNRYWAKVLNVSQQAISNLRIKENRGVGRGAFSYLRHYVSPENMAIMLNPEISVTEAFRQTGHSKCYILKQRRKNGIVTVIKKKELPPKVTRVKKEKVVKPPKVKEAKPKPKVIISRVITKEEPKRKEHEDKVKVLGSMSVDEQNRVHRQAALESNVKQIEQERLASGKWKYVEKFDRFGKRFMSLSKID